MRVRVKDWADMAQQHKVCGDGHIILSESNEVFSPMMAVFCGKEYEVESSRENFGIHNYRAYYLKGLAGWIFPAESVDVVREDKI